MEDTMTGAEELFEARTQEIQHQYVKVLEGGGGPDGGRAGAAPEDVGDALCQRYEG
jgi:hypothetical protein